MSETLNLAQIELLARVDLFAGLDRVALAKLVAYLEPLPIGDGLAVCHQGDPADGLYIIVRGSFGAFVVAPDGGETRLATLRAGDFFGEMALLTNEPRTATVRAEGAGEVLRLESGRFLQLCRQDTTVALTIAATLSQRLRVSDQVYLERDRLIDLRLGQVLGRLPADQRDRLFRASVLESLSGTTLSVLFGDEAEAVARAFAVLGTDGDFPETQVLPALRRHVAVTLGPERIAALEEETARRLAEAGCWDDALAILSRQGERPRFVTVLGEALRGTPPLPPEQARPWLERLTDEEAAADPDLALGRAALLAERGNSPVAAALLRRALSQAMASGAMTGVQRLAAALSQATAPETAVVAEPAPAPFAQWAHWQYPGAVKVGAAIAAAGLAAAAAFSTQQQLTFVLLLAAAIVLWASRLLPDFAVSFGLVAAWLLYGLATPAQAASGFASMDWLFALAVFGLAAAIARSGLLFRVGLLFVRRLPQGLFWQAATLLGTGLILMPLLPSNAGRLAMTMPLALAVSEASRLHDRSPAAATLGLAAWIGSTPLMFICLNASSLCLLAWGLLPPASKNRFDWFHWFGAAAPLGVFVSLGMLAALFLILRPQQVARPERARVAVQLAVLGPPSRREGAMIAIMALTAIGWFGGPAIGLNAGVVAVAGLLLATIVGNFDGVALQALDWNYLIFYGVALSIARLGVALGVDQRAASSIGGPLSALGLSPFFFVLLLAGLSLVVRLVLPQNLGVLLLGLAFIPVAPVIGVEPWIVIIALLATSALWFFPAQTPYYLFALSTSEDRLFAHAQARRVAFAYAAVALLGLALTFPYWRLLGLV